MIIKLNSLEDERMISRLYEASRARVNIQLIVRGICCLLPQVKGLVAPVKAGKADLFALTADQL